MKTLKRTLLVAFCAFVPACASTATNAASAQRHPTTVVVDNQALLDMTIYVLNGGQRVRLGTANGLSTTRLTIPSSIILGARSLRFIADPIGGNRSPVSEEINIVEGDEIGLRIPPV
jgi:hypothetical protein